MKTRRRVTVSLTSDTLRFVDRQAGEHARSRSAVIESLILESHRRTREIELGRRAKEFFALAPAPEETAEDSQWLEMSLEAQRHDR
jgi:metal-responsive CopG/Arc/MetJ family transcriptional regulator